MALSDEMIGLLNPWWIDPRWAATDPHLEALDANEQVALASPAFVDELEFGDCDNCDVCSEHQPVENEGRI